MERIVKEISSKIDLVLLHVATYPIGLESRVLAINSLFQIGLTDKVIMKKKEVKAEKGEEETLKIKVSSWRNIKTKFL
ncbi:hypothetical protein K1719_020774 [Acacia pycnantha]|nr:hypothetical protein K1719_020774 [Acacia pycnantha]